MPMDRSLLCNRMFFFSCSFAKENRQRTHTACRKETSKEQENTKRNAKEMRCVKNIGRPGNIVSRGLCVGESFFFVFGLSPLSLSIHSSSHLISSHIGKILILVLVLVWVLLAHHPRIHRLWKPIALPCVCEHFFYFSSLALQSTALPSTILPSPAQPA